MLDVVILVGIGVCVGIGIGIAIGISIGVAIARSVWDRYVVPDDASRMLGQSVAGRLWDVLYLLWHAVLRFGPNTSELRFPVAFVTDGDRTETAMLKAVAGGGDHGELVVTVMLPEED